MHMADRVRELADRIRLVRERMGKSQKEFAAALDASFRAYQDYEAGKIVPGGRVLAAMARLGVDTNWLLNGEGSSAPTANALRPVAHVDGRSGQARDPVLGLAAIAHSPTLTSMEVRGDSMAPDLAAGDLVIFDRAAVAVETGMVALRMGGQLVIRRLQLLMDGVVQIQPANPLYQSETMTTDAAAAIIAGHVTAILHKV
mgnify:CR=1 FL=1